MLTISSKIGVFTVFSLFTSFIDSAMAEYCEQDLCTTKQYCCGINECCTTFDTWLLIGCLLLALVILSVGGACIYRFYCLNSALRRSNSRSRLVTT